MTATGPPARTGQAWDPLAELRVLVGENPGPLTLDGTRTYLIGRRRLVVLDPGPPGSRQAERVMEATEGRSVEAVCLTHAHRDHAGCASQVASALGAPVAASGETLGRLGVQGRALRDGDEVPVDGGEGTLRALATPGHSADGLSYLWLPPRRLFTGDLVLGRGSSLVVHPDGAVGPYLSSLARLLSLRPTLLLPGHGEPVEGAVRKLEEYRRHRLERDAQVREALAAGARSPEEVRRRVYGELSDDLRRAAELSVLAHLRHLREMGHGLPPELRAALEVSEGTEAGEEP